jgi:hypothetical protein
MDLGDPRLRLRVQALTQLCRTERERALALYRFVKRMPFTKPMKLRLHTARQVLDHGHGDAVDKATLLVAMLRIAGLPARLRYIELHGAILRGLTGAITSAGRPVLEVWTGKHWAATDTYIFDAHYVASAREQMRQRGWDWGYGMHVRGHGLWNGREDAFLTGDAATTAEISLGVLGRFHDPLEFVRSDVCRERYPRLARSMRWNLLARSMNRAVTELRAAGDAPPLDALWCPA